MTTDDTQHSDWENHIAAMYRAAPAPLEGIWREAVARSSSAHKSRGSRVAIELAAAVAVAVALVGVIAVPRLVARFSTPSGPVATVRPSSGGASSSPVELTCRLPIAILTPPAAATEGFLRVDTGAYSAGAASAANGEAYAQQLGKWVPTNAQQVAPDGASYVYVDATTTESALHFVDRQQDRLIVSSPGPIQVLGFVSTQSVAYTAQDAAGRLGTWLLDTATLQPRIVASDHVYQGAGGGALWRIGAAAQGSGIALYRLDLHTGAETLWFDVDGYLGAEPTHSPSFNSEGVARTPQDSLHHSFGILGFDDSGHPIVQLGSAGAGALSAALLVTGQDVVQTLVTPGTNGPGHLDAQSAAGGRAAVWLVDPAGQVAVYRGRGPLAIIASLPVPAGGKAEVAGPCT
jgi:ribosomal protein S11